MADVLVSGIKISEMELVNDISGTEKMPTDQVGDKAVSIDQILIYVNNKVKPVWGNIQGDINKQTDLMNMVNTKDEFIRFTLQTAIDDLQDQINALGGGASYGYTSYAAMVADAANIPAKSVVTVGGDPDPTKDGMYIYDGTNFTKSPYDPLQQAKNYADANPLFKPIQIKAGDDFNTLTKQGFYYHWGPNLTSSQVLNAPYYNAGNLPFGVWFITNPAPDGLKNAGVTQTFYPRDDGLPPFIRKVSLTTGDFPATWGSYVTRATQYSNFDVITTGQDVLTLPVGRYGIPSVTVGNSMLNMPTMPYKFGRIEVDYSANTGYKIIKIFPYGRDTNFYVNKSYEAGAWSGWKTFKDYESFKVELDATYADKNALAQAVAGALNNITQDKYYGKQFTQSELNGSALYSASYYTGVNGNTGPDGANFNSVKANMWNTDSGNVEYRIYFGTKVSTSAFGNYVLAANVNSPNFSGICKSFPTTDAGEAQEIELDQVVSIPPNTPFVIVFRDSDIKIIRIRHFTAATGNLENRGFNIVASTGDWGSSNISVTSTPNFTQAGFQLLLTLPNSGGVTPEPIYVPNVILPPKLYALEGLESNVFLEHTVPEDYNLYDFDFTCSKGMHKARGWRWLPTSADVAGNYSMSLAAKDKQTDALLATASTTVVLANKNSNNGVTKKVQVIGDSLVASGSITQGLLNNAGSDVMGINLIGTRGTAPNLHEGRGGWTINDYTGAGRTYFRFTVSGVTVAPAINSATYTYNGTTYMVQETALTGGSGTITCNVVTGSNPVAGSSGTLTKSNTSDGDATIAFTDVQPVSGNPFWNGTAIDYQNYLTTNGLQTPEVVVIQLGINDTFSLGSDTAVVDLCATAFPKLDVLINSILAVNSTIKVAVCAPPSYASQDAFGYNYACGQTSRRAKRNITTFNKQLFAYYNNKEASRIYVISGGINMDALNNFPESTVAVNARNSKTTIEQTNGVHPAASGYYQESDVMFAFIKTT